MFSRKVCTETDCFENLNRLVDFFNKLDTDGSMTLNRDEFKTGIQMAGIPMTETEIEALLDVLDRDGDGEINYRLPISPLNTQLKLWPLVFESGRNFLFFEIISMHFRLLSASRLLDQQITSEITNQFGYIIILY